ncbi:uncharacterized protein UV8b_07690 [Ustilaginoidea virens]|uniref:Uncharacterized protein n=1 Tax=Ustilaginoidea virens TaxID=1159556 RepID=A0A8E5HXH5_USTVR|nr:uncharacterized protein UV8b_07690 [Ustilaginoidea virens]QUC23449.1 hypothetical protein UV8b_07690 [Ustilaginoidea virens]
MLWFAKTTCNSDNAAQSVKKVDLDTSGTQAHEDGKDDSHCPLFERGPQTSRNRYCQLVMSICRRRTYSPQIDEHTRCSEDLQSRAVLRCENFSLEKSLSVRRRNYQEVDALDQYKEGFPDENITENDARRGSCDITQQVVREKDEAGKPCEPQP